MKRILTISIIMINLLNLFGCKFQNENDPYWEFNKNEHFRPELNKGEFFKFSGYDFGWFVLEPISKFVKDKEHEIERGKSLSYGQKALYYWWYLDAQVTNGGFVQFYYNGYGPYVPTIIKGLEHIGDTEMANLVKKADKIYQKNKKLMDKAQESDLFGSDLYDRLDEMSLLDDKYYEMNEKTMSLIESYIRKNPNEICLDKDGKEFDMTFAGLCKTFYDNKKVKEEFNLEQGVINGEYKLFFQNGNLKEKLHYLKGEQTGELKEFYENGELKYKVTKDATNKTLIHQWYFDNGNPKKIESKLIGKNERVGKYKEWYKNGQLAETGTYKSAYEREGEWLEFYEDGNKKSETEYKDNSNELKNYWNEEGEQTLKNGTGYSKFYSKPFFKDDLPELHFREYKNFVAHGVWKEFKNDTLKRLVNYRKGKRHGIMETFYNNGKLEKRTIYENDKVVSEETFMKFENPIILTKIICEMESEWLVNRELETADLYPTLINKKELEQNFKVSTSIFEAYSNDKELSYSYFVSIDKTGKPTKLDFLVADNGFVTKEVESNIGKMIFKPAQRNGVNINSYLIIKHKLKLGE